MTEFKDKLTEMFKLLRKEKIVARQNFLCCQSCAGAALSQDKRMDKKETLGYAYYHRQDSDDLKNGFVYIAFGPRKDGDETAWLEVGLQIVKAASDVGLSIQWDGTTNQRIRVLAGKEEK